MSDALNSIVQFINSIVDLVATMCSYIASFFRFIASGVVFLYQCISFVPLELQAIATLTIVLSVVLLIVGRSNNNG